MNEKLAKALRGAAKYRNQSKTPGEMPFPGVARFYVHPVVTRRDTLRTSYVHVPGDEPGVMTKVFTKVSRLATFNNRPPAQEMESVVVTEDGLDVNGNTIQVPVLDADLNKVTEMRPKMEQVPVPKPGLLDPKCAKGVYRALKRKTKRGELVGLAKFMQSNQEGVSDGV